jgi:hypothetical protein
MDTELFKVIMDEHELLVKQVAMESGLSTSAIDRYRNANGKTPPLVAWRALVKLTDDLRPAEAMLRGTGWHVTKLANVDFGSLPDGLAALVECQRKALRTTALFLDIWADGDVSADEGRQVEDFCTHANRLIACLLMMQNRTRRLLREAQRAAVGGN